MNVSHLNVSRLAARSVLAAAIAALLGPVASTVAAAQNGPTRAEVKSRVIDARKADRLVPAGPGRNPQYSWGTASNTTRAVVRSDVLDARARGELIPAGPAVRPVFHASTPGTLTRAEVRAKVLEAQSRGEMIPAGPGVRARN